MKEPYARGKIESANLLVFVSAIPIPPYPTGHRATSHIASSYYITYDTNMILITHTGYIILDLIPKWTVWAVPKVSIALLEYSHGYTLCSFEDERADCE